MAEKVQERLEAMLPELEDLKSKSLFNEKEIAQIVKKRTSLEYSVSRRIAKKADYIRYIEYEMNLEKLRVKRKSRFSKNKKTTLSDYAGVRRIYNLFERGLLKFKGDLKLWLQYIDFAESQNSSKVVSKAYGKAIKLLPGAEILWIQAANFEFSKNLNMEAARVLMQRGVRLNLNNKILYLEFFRLELKFIEKLKLRKEILLKDKAEGHSIEIDNLDQENQEEGLEMEGKINASLQEEDPLLQGAIPKIIYNNTVQKFPTDFDLRARFLDILDSFSPIVELHSYIYNSILADFADDDRAKDLIFKRDMLHLNENSAEFVDKLSACIEKYEQALSAKSSPLLLSLFVGFLFNYYQSIKEANLKTFFSLKLKKVLKEGLAQSQNDSYLLTKEFYFVYLNFIQDCIKSDRLLSQVATEACKKYPNIVEFWLVKLQTISEKDLNKINAILSEAIIYNPISNNLWEKYINVTLKSIENNTSDKYEGDIKPDFNKQELIFLNSLYKIESVHSNNEVEAEERRSCREFIHSNMLKWAFDIKGINYVRELAERISKKVPLSVVFYKEWIQLELKDYEQNIHGDKSEPKSEEMYQSFKSLFDKRILQVANSKFDKIKILYEKLLRLDSNDIELWLDYLAFLNHAAPSHHASTLLLKAKQTLSKELYFALEQEYKAFITLKKDQEL